MITRSEAEFFSECARGPIPSGGSIVDLGCYMGSTAISLARGVIDSRCHDMIYSYDLFEWAEWMNGSPTLCVYEPGDVFLPEARRYTRDHGFGLIDVRKADLSKYHWEGGRISLLLVDAMKSFDVARQITRSFLPALLPGAWLIHQDYKHYWTGWIHLLQFRLRHRFELLKSVADGGTVAFVVTSEINPAEAITATDFEHISDDEIIDAFAYSMRLLPLTEQANVAAAHVMMLHHLGRDDAGLARVVAYRQLGLVEKGEFPHMIRQYFPSAHVAAIAA